MTKQITVIAAVNQEALEQYGADVVNEEVDTIAEAKVRAKYYLTEAYADRAEYAPRLRYAQVVVDGEIRYDFFAK